MNPGYLPTAVLVQEQTDEPCDRRGIAKYRLLW
jgi:hypothetical protein